MMIQENDYIYLCSFFEKTTIMAAEFADGVVLGADCRTTSGYISFYID